MWFLFGVGLLLGVQKFENLLGCIQSTFVCNICLLLRQKAPQKKLLLEVVMYGMPVFVEILCPLELLDIGKAMIGHEWGVVSEKFLSVECEDFGDGVCVVIKTFLEVSQFDAKHGAGEHHWVDFVPKGLPEIQFDQLPFQQFLTVES